MRNKRILKDALVFLEMCALLLHMSLQNTSLLFKTKKGYSMNNMNLFDITFLQRSLVYSFVRQYMLLRLGTQNTCRKV
jgi:hypothetical protein